MGLNSLRFPLQNEKPCSQPEPSIALRVGRNDPAKAPPATFEGIIGKSSALRRVLQMIETVAREDSTVLLLGETGTGKELIARAIHGHSSRNARPFVKLNCAAIPTGLLESELFGHERGSFTGAIAQKIGRLELAHQGSLFLDEMGDIPLELQPKLLRVLQEREFERLGSTRTQKVDVRIVAATHRDLEGMIIEKQFRSDLYYRVNVFPIQVPPLRERPDDIPLLVEHFVRQATQRMGKTINTIPQETADALSGYRWPGNIRELENAIRRAHVMAKSDAILLADLPPEISGLASSVSMPALSNVAGDAATTDAAALARQLFQWAKRDPKLKVIPAVERELVIQALKETNNNQVHAANLLGITRATLRKRIDKFGIQRELNVK